MAYHVKAVMKRCTWPGGAWSLGRGSRRLTVLVTVTVEGATATDTFLQGGGLASTTLSIAELRISMPEGRSTCMTPQYCTRITFLGSSMGVGKDCAVKVSDINPKLNLEQFF